MNELLDAAFIQQIISENPRIRPNWMVKIITGDQFDVGITKYDETKLPQSKDYIVL